MATESVTRGPKMRHTGAQDASHGGPRSGTRAPTRGTRAPELLDDDQHLALLDGLARLGRHGGDGAAAGE
jgi:hypothetical protein